MGSVDVLTTAVCVSLLTKLMLTLFIFWLILIASNNLQYQ